MMDNNIGKVEYQKKNRSHEWLLSKVMLITSLIRLLILSQLSVDDKVVRHDSLQDQTSTKHSSIARVAIAIKLILASVSIPSQHDLIHDC